jgi:glucose-1-phosphate thymidylyltransferase
LRTQKFDDVIGLIPAAGQAARLSPLPCSKELIPVGFGLSSHNGRWSPRVACQFLLERLHLAGISKAFIILRQGKWDIPQYLVDGGAVGVHIGYLMMGLPYGSPYTINQAWPFVQGKRIALGFPDVIFEPEDAFVSLLNHQEVSGADVVLGLFPSRKPEKMDMVETDIHGKVLEIVIKPKATTLKYSWMIAVWTPNFTGFMHEYLVQVAGRFKESKLMDKGGFAMNRELYVGDVIQAGMEAGLRVEAVTFKAGSCIDLGTPEDLALAISTYG